MPNPNVIQFFEQAKEALFVSTCSHTKSGCRQFCQSLAEPFKAELTEVQSCTHAHSSPTDDLLPTFKVIRYAKFKPYKIIVITGCDIEFSSNIVDLIKKSYALNSIEKVHVIVPPHLATTVKKATLEEGFTLSDNINLLYAGITLDEAFPVIGLPNPIQPIQEYNVPYGIAAEYSGLMYLNPLELPESTKYQSFLEAYFQQISKISPLGTVIIVGYCDETMIRIATSFHINLALYQRIPPNSFQFILQQMGQRKGIFACNGTQALIEAMYFGCQFFVFLDKVQNKAFFTELLDTTSDEQKPTANSLLGLDETYNNINHPQMGYLALHFQTRVKQAIAKFDALKTTSTSLKIANKLTTHQTLTEAGLFKSPKPRPSQHIILEILLLISQAFDALAFYMPFSGLISLGHENLKNKSAFRP